MSIITGVLGGRSLITQGYGGKWKKAELNPKRVIELCPNCGSILKETLYYSKDPFSGRKIFRCRKCYATLYYEDGKWKEERAWYRD